jgi:hypothetical protein
MANEAWETQAVRSVRLHAVALPLGERAFAAADGGFVRSRLVVPPSTCRAAGGDCLAAVVARDSIEWSRTTDSTDLAAPDSMLLTFPPSRAALGLVLGARQSFVSTFVFYQTMAYLGQDAGAWLAGLERGDSTAHRAVTQMNHLLGEIAVAVEDGGTRWRQVGRFTEAGPIAGDVQLFPLGTRASDDSVRVRLTFARGSWRVGYVALATISEAAGAVVLEPTSIRALGRTRAADQRLDGRAYLVTYPGDQYQLQFDLPSGAPAYALFLESRGYYYEWMRGEWLREENPQMAAMLLLDPHEALRRLAPDFKSRESEFEAHFWASRFGRR